MDETPKLMDGPPPGALNFHSVFAAVPTPLMVMDRQLTIVYANEAYLRTTARTLSDLQNRYVFDAFPESPDRMALFKSAFERALAGEANVLTTEPFSVPAPDEPSGVRNIVWTCSHTPIADDGGEIAFVLQNAVDVTAKHQADRHSEVLLRELDHRVKNSLATIQAIARQSMVETKTMKEAHDDFSARIGAMAHVHDLLVGDKWAGTKLRAVLSQALRPFGYSDCGGPPIILRGPAVQISARQAQAFAMAIHELATNAAKYGALSNQSGSVDVEWSHDPSDDGAFRLIWRERDGPSVQTPERRGFGTVMLTNILAQEIGGTITLEHAADGVVCRMAGTLCEDDD